MNHYGWLKNAGMFAVQAVNVVCAYHLFTRQVGNLTSMEGPSMLPTFSARGDWIVEYIWPYRHHPGPENVTRGELITFRSPINPTRIVCKRVIGLPGDVMCVDPTGRTAPSTEHVIVPPHHVWVMGDNALYSIDSREYGPLSTALIRGRIVCRLWPWADAQIVKTPSTTLGWTKS